MKNILIAGYSFPSAFSECKKRIETGVNLKNKSKKSYSLIHDPDQTESSYQRFCEQIPFYPGILILYGYDKSGKYIPVEILVSNENLKTAFKKAKNLTDTNLISRKNWLLHKIQHLKLDRIHCQLAYIKETKKSD